MGNISNPTIDITVIQLSLTGSTVIELYSITNIAIINVVII